MDATRGCVQRRMSSDLTTSPSHLPVRAFHTVYGRISSECPPSLGGGLAQLVMLLVASTKLINARPG